MTFSLHSTNPARPASPGRPSTQRLLTELDSAVLDGLGPQARDAAYATGRRLTSTEAIALILRGRGEQRRVSSGWDSLTATERQVVDLVADGLTNPAIAERLLMGRATVKTHVSHALTKLGLQNRTELAAEATRRR